MIMYNDGIYYGHAFIKSHLINIQNTIKQESLVAIIFGSFSNMTIWQRINLPIFDFGIFKDGYVFILVTIHFSEFD